MDLQDYLKDLLTIECDIQSKLNELKLIKTSYSLEFKSNEIKTLFKDYKLKLNEINDLCNLNLSSSSNNSKIEVYLNELKIQTEHLHKLEARFRNEYYVIQKKIANYEREQLFDDSTNGSTGDGPRERKINNDIVFKQTKLLTSNLIDLNRTMKSSLEHSNITLSKLQTSSNNIKQTQDEFSQMSLNINDSKRLLTKYDRREFTNKLLFIFSLFLFFSVVFYIVWKRLF